MARQDQLRRSEVNWKQKGYKAALTREERKQELLRLYGEARERAAILKALIGHVESCPLTLPEHEPLDKNDLSEYDILCAWNAAIVMDIEWAYTHALKRELQHAQEMITAIEYRDEKKIEKLWDGFHKSRNWTQPHRQ